MLYLPSIVHACASINSATGLKAFSDLRDASSDVAVDYQAKAIHENLYFAISKRKISVYHTLCAIEMLLRHGKKDGLLGEMLKPKGVQELGKYLNIRIYGLPIETQQLLAKHVYVKSNMTLF